MIKKIYIVMLVLIGLGGLSFLIQLSLKGKAVVKIAWSDFASEDEVANAISMRLRQELKDHNVVFLGVEPGSKNQLSIFKKWVNLNTEPGWKFDEVFIEPELVFRQEVWPEAKIFDIRKDQETFVQLVRDLKKTNHRVVVVVPQIYSSQLIVDNPVKRVIKESEQEILSITLVAIDNTELPCTAEGADYTGQSALGCVVKEKLFFTKNKKTKSGVLWSGMLEQYGLSDFLMFIKNP